MDVADNPIADQLYRDVFFNSPLGLYTLDAEGVITSFNPKMAELSGDKPENAIGLNALHLESYKKVGLDVYFRQGIEESRSFEVEVAYQSHLASKKTIRHYRGVPIEDHGIIGQARLLLIVEDVTEQKLTEQKLEQFAQFTAENTNPLLRVDTAGRILLKNTVADQLITTIAGVASDMVPSALKVPILESIEQNHTHSLDFSHEDKIFLFEIVPVTSHNYANVYGRDVTEERNTQKIKDHFLSVTSHELRTPMTVVRGYLELMLQMRAGPLNETQVSYMQKMLESVKSLIEFVNVTLDMNKLESGEVQLDMKSSDISTSIHKVVESMRNLFDQAGILLEYNPVAVSVSIDPLQFERVITNLLGNAMKFTKSGGKVSISTQLNESEVVISVTDNGIGIAEDDQKLLFQKYAQIENKWVSRMRGTGLGLVISKDIVEKMNGKIWVESKVDEGSTFFVSLPLH